MKRSAALALTIGVLGSAAPAGAAERKPVTFEGTCALSGTLVQDPPMTAVPAPGGATGAAAASASEDPAAIAAACASPAGLRSVALDIQLATTPAISG